MSCHTGGIANRSSETALRFNQSSYHLCENNSPYWSLPTTLANIDPLWLPTRLEADNSGKARVFADCKSPQFQWKQQPHVNSRESLTYWVSHLCNILASLVLSHVVGLQRRWLYFKCATLKYTTLLCLNFCGVLAVPCPGIACQPVAAEHTFFSSVWLAVLSCLFSCDD